MARQTSILLLSLGLAGTCCSAASLPALGERDNRNPGFLSFPIEHARRDKPLIQRRDEDTGVPLFNVSTVSYLIELSIGTPGQKVKVAVDTGSDELWVNPNCNDQELLASQQEDCELNGQYNAARSSTASVDKVVGNATETIQYGLGRVAMRYTTDNIALPNSDIELKSVQFAVATNTEDLNEGILGLSYGRGKNLVYNNLVDALFEQNVTDSKSFSVALGSAEANNGGVIIFGGVDTKKFSGDLFMNSILPPQFDGDINRYYVQLNSIELDSGGEKTSYSGARVPAVLDTGTSLTYFPQRVISQLTRDLGGALDTDSGFYVVPCSLMRGDDTLDFDFGNGTISVPLSAILLPVTTQWCALGSAADPDRTGIEMLLGDTFLRSVYAVFDQTTNTVGMAPYANCGQNEQALPASGPEGLKGECRAGDLSGGSNNDNNEEDKDNAGGRVVVSYRAVWVGVAVGLLGLVMV